MDPRSPGEAALEARLAQLRPGLELLGLPACVLDPQLRYHFLNAAYVAHAGRPAADFIGRNPDEVFALRPGDARRGQMQLDFLAREGCQAAQGYLISPPIPADDFERWLAARNAPARRRATSRARKPKVAT